MSKGPVKTGRHWRNATSQEPPGAGRQEEGSFPRVSAALPFSGGNGVGLELALRLDLGPGSITGAPCGGQEMAPKDTHALISGTCYLTGYKAFCSCN